MGMSGYVPTGGAAGPQGMNAAMLFGAKPAMDVEAEALEAYVVPVLVAWIVVELLFWLACSQLKARLQTLSTPPAYGLSKRELMQRVLRLLEELAPAYTVADFLSGWFLGAPWEKITLSNARSFFSWALYARREAGLSPDETRELDELLEEAAAFADHLGYPIRRGPPTPGLRHVDFTLAPLESLHRPLLWYAIVALKAQFTCLVLLVSGFQRLELGGLVYWHRAARDAGRPALGLGMNDDRPRLPLVCFHGISSGISLYLPLLLRITAGRAAVIVEQPHISMALNLAPPSRDQVVAGVTAICRRHRIGKACFMGHSFGSVPLAWLVDAKSPHLGQLMLLDPVSPLLALPTVAYNFLYRRPARLVEWLIYLAASSELGIAYTLRRNFWWYQNCLWLDKIPEDVPVVFGLAGGDEVCPARLLALHAGNFAKARGDKVRICYWPGFSHGQLLVDPASQDQVFTEAYEQETKCVLPLAPGHGNLRRADAVADVPKASWPLLGPVAHLDRS